MGLLDVGGSVRERARAVTAGLRWQSFCTQFASCRVERVAWAAAALGEIVAIREVCAFPLPPSASCMHAHSEQLANKTMSYFTHTCTYDRCTLQYTTDQYCELA